MARKVEAPKKASKKLGKPKPQFTESDLRFEHRERIATVIDCINRRIAELQEGIDQLTEEFPGFNWDMILQQELEKRQPRETLQWRPRNPIPAFAS